jgi:hypothetical protein
MRDVDDIEHSEGDRDAGRHGGVKASEQQSGDDRIDQERRFHAGLSPPIRMAARSDGSIGAAGAMLQASWPASYPLVVASLAFCRPSFRAPERIEWTSPVPLFANGFRQWSRSLHRSGAAWLAS